MIKEKEQKQLEFEKVLENQKIANELIKVQLIQSEEYYKWLSDFSLNHIKFSTVQFDEIPMGIQDYAKVKLLRILFMLIEEYANQNHIYCLFDEKGPFYLFTSNNVKYAIGFTVYTKFPHHYCHRLPEDYKGEFIDINVIKYDYFSKNNLVDKRMEMLKQTVRNLLEENYSEEEIINAVKTENVATKVRKIGGK